MALPVAAAPAREPPVYRPFAMLAFGTTLVLGTPLGIWMLGRLHLWGGQVQPEWTLLHARLQVFGFFGVLILGVARHLVPRFANRPVVAGGLSPWLLGLVAIALVLDVGGTLARRPAWLLAGALLRAGAFAAFGVWVWRELAPRHLALARVQLSASTAWLVLALGLEALLRAPALASGADPDPAGMRVTHAVALLGGVAGWIVGVAVRAGPMFVPGWAVPIGLARAAPALLAGGPLLVALGELGVADRFLGVALARLGELVALATVVVLALTGGIARRAPRTLPMLARGGPETGLFRLAFAAAAVGALGMALAAAQALWRVPASLLADALRHLVTVGFLTAVVVAMTFRLIPVLEGVPLPWPRLRSAAPWALFGGVLLRSAEALPDHGAEAILPWVPLSGVLVWVALAGAAANLVGAMRARAGAVRGP